MYFFSTQRHHTLPRGRKNTNIEMGNALGPHRTLPKEDLNFLMNNTNFTKKQIKEWYQGFIVSSPSLLSNRSLHRALL